MTAIHATPEETPPELAADITTEGILLAGGGSLLRGFEDRVARETGMPVRLADDPLACVATGAGMSLEDSTPSRAVVATVRPDLYTPVFRDRWPSG